MSASTDISATLSTGTLGTVEEDRSQSEDEVLNQINADLLPPQARKLVRLIGMAQTLKLLELRGGITLRIPVKAEDSDVLLAILPLAAVQKLSESMPGQRLELPKCDKIIKQLRNLAIRQARAQHSASQLATAYGLTRRHIINLTRPLPDDSQADLFE
jgi:hypothetical protein